MVFFSEQETSELRDVRNKLKILSEAIRTVLKKQSEHKNTKLLQRIDELIKYNTLLSLASNKLTNKDCKELLSELTKNDMLAEYKKLPQVKNRKISIENKARLFNNFHAFFAYIMVASALLLFFGFFAFSIALAACGHTALAVSINNWFFGITTDVLFASLVAQPCVWLFKKASDLAVYSYYVNYPDDSKVSRVFSGKLSLSERFENDIVESFILLSGENPSQLQAQQT